MGQASAQCFCRQSYAFKSLTQSPVGLMESLHQVLKVRLCVHPMTTQSDHWQPKNFTLYLHRTKHFIIKDYTLLLHLM